MPAFSARTAASGLSPNDAGLARGAAAGAPSSARRLCFCNLSGSVSSSAADSGPSPKESSPAFGKAAPPAVAVEIPAEAGAWSIFTRRAAGAAPGLESKRASTASPDNDCRKPGVSTKPTGAAARQPAAASAAVSAMMLFRQRCRRDRGGSLAQSHIEQKLAAGLLRDALN